MVLIQTIKKTHVFDICKFKTTLSLNGVGALKCECIAVWGHCRMEEFQVWEGCSVGSCGVGEFRYVVVAVWGVAMWGICGVGVLRYGELLCVGVTGWESCSVGESWCGRVAVCVNCCVWQL